MTSDDPLHLACAARGPYVAHSAAMLRSVLVDGGRRRTHVHYLADAGERDLETMGSFVESLGGVFEPTVVSEEAIAGLPVQPEFTAAMWYRILLPETLPDVGRILYLDVDTLIVDDLAPLWETDLRGSYLGAVTNVFQHNHVHRPAALGIPNGQLYFNSGVLLMDLEAMRRDQTSAQIRDVASERAGELEWPDQDALNLVLGGRREPLHPRWNLMNSIRLFPSSREVLGQDAVEEALQHPGIWHFEGPGPNKPWHYLCDHPARQLYLEHRSQTPWPRVDLEGRTPRNRVKSAFARARRAGRGGRVSA